MTESINYVCRRESLRINIISEIKQIHKRPFRSGFFKSKITIVDIYEIFIMIKY